MKPTLDTRVIDLTLGQLLDAVEARVRQVLADGEATQKKQEGKRYIYGLKGLAQLLGCSKTTASRVKQSGVIDRAITQVGALLIIDADMALELARAASNKRN